MEPSPNGTYGQLGRKGRVRAPALPSAPQAWLNGPPQDLRNLVGRPVLLDFWTGGCLNCVHAAREIEALKRRHPALQVIGIHTPKFQREAHPEQVRLAIARLGLTHPVYNDADGYLREQYTIRAWPTLVLLDLQGRIVQQVAGEEQTDKLASLIAAMLQGQPLPAAVEDTPPTRNQGFWLLPQKITTDAPSGRFFVADSGHHRLLAFSAEGELLAQAGGRQGFQDGAADEAALFQPQGMAFDATRQQLYFADSGNHALRCWDLTKQTVYTLVGDGKQGRGYRPGWQGSKAQLNAPWDLAWHQGWLYLANAGSHQIWRYQPQQQQLEVVLGTGEENVVDGPAEQALLGQPMALVSDGTSLYWLDAEGSALRQWDGQQAKTLVGTGLFAFGSADGQYPAAQLQHPQGMAYQAGCLWIADTYNQALRCYHLQTGRLSTVRRGFHQPVDLAWLGQRLLLLDGELLSGGEDTWQPAILFRCEADRCEILQG